MRLHSCFFKFWLTSRLSGDTRMLFRRSWYARLCSKVASGTSFGHSSAPVPKIMRSRCGTRGFAAQTVLAKPERIIFFTAFAVFPPLVPRCCWMKLFVQHRLNNKFGAVDHIYIGCTWIIIQNINLHFWIVFKKLTHLSASISMSIQAAKRRNSNNCINP